jgi:hypothetical protein
MLYLKKEFIIFDSEDKAMIKKTSAVLTDSKTLDEVIDVLNDKIDIHMQGACDKKTLLEILVRAASLSDSIEHTCKTIEDVPGANNIRYHLEKLDDMEKTEESLNQALKSRIPPRIRKGKLKIAIDLNLIPYYGVPSETEAPYIYRGQAKSGTCSFYAYATVYVISKGRRITLALHAVRRDETMVCIITRLLDRISELEVKIKRLYLDRGFYSVPVIRWLQANDIPYEMPVIIRGKQNGTRSLVNKKRTYKTPYTMNSNSYGSVTFEVWVVGTYYKGKHGRHGVDYMAFAVYKVPIPIRAIPEDYRKRFGIETSYRLKNLSRIRTSNKNPVARLLFVGIAFLLVVLWIYILWTYISKPRKGGRLLYPKLFDFKTMLNFLRQSVDRKHCIKEAIYLQE